MWCFVFHFVCHCSTPIFHSLANFIDFHTVFLSCCCFQALSDDSFHARPLNLVGFFIHSHASFIRFPHFKVWFFIGFSKAFHQDSTIFINRFVCTRQTFSFTSSIPRPKAQPEHVDVAVSLGTCLFCLRWGFFFELVLAIADLMTRIQLAYHPFIQEFVEIRPFLNLEMI